MRVRSLDAGPGRLVATLGADALLDPAKLTTWIQKSKGAYKLTPDMKLVAKIPEGVAGTNLISEAKRIVKELGRTALPTADA
jgi:transcription-repair coupling factor (superfamily II helicase)